MKGLIAIGIFMPIVLGEALMFVACSDKSPKRFMTIYIVGAIIFLALYFTVEAVIK